MTARLWLPEGRRFEVLSEAVPTLRLALARSDRLADVASGCEPLFSEAFPDVAQPLPIAAWSRDVDVPHDAEGRWLRADPCQLRIEPSGVRVMAIGDPGLAADDVAVLRDCLAPVFADAGWRFDAPTAGRWYVQLPADADAIGGRDPDWALGRFVDAALPAGDAGRATRQWLNVAQMALHVQARSAAALAVNSVWLHGDGVAPTTLRASVRACHSSDPALIGAARRAGVAVLSSPHELTGPVLVDARDVDDAAIAATRTVLSRATALVIGSVSGQRWRWRSWHRWRFWRGPA